MVSMLIVLVASSPEISAATLSLEVTRLAMSPAKRWPKKAIGRVTTWRKKREVVTRESFVSIRARQSCCSQVSAPCMTAAVPRPIRSGRSRVSLRGMSTSSTNTLEIVGTARPGITRIRVAMTT